MIRRKGAVPLITLFLIVFIGVAAWVAYNKALSDIQVIVEPLVAQERYEITTGDKLSDVVLNMPLIPGHPLTVIEYGRKVSNPIADAYYWGQEKTPVIEDTQPVKLKDIIETGPENTVIVFNKAKCPFCAVLLPYYRDLQEEYGEDLQIVMIYESIQNTEEAARLAKELAEKNMRRPQKQDYKKMKFLAIEPHIAAIFDKELNIDHVPKLIWVNKKAIVTALPNESDFLEYFKTVEGYTAHNTDL